MMLTTPLPADAFRAGLNLETNAIFANGFAFIP
jgi:hypothetical protein